MAKDISSFIIRLLIFSSILFGIHFYIIYEFFDKKIYIPLYVIYIFNILLVFLVYSILNYKNKQGSKKMYQLFLGLTILKMALSIIFLLPVILGKSDHVQLEILNFFIPYFLFLTFEIFSINNFLQKS
jgi:hypothetical protein